MGNVKENYEIMFTTYPDVVNIFQLKEDFWKEHIFHL